MGDGTIQITEVIWTLAAIPGLIVWTGNLHNAVNSLRGASQLGSARTQALAWTLVRLAASATIAELVFIGWGLFGMTQSPAVNHITPLGWAITGGIVVIASVTMFVGFDIRQASRVVWRLANQSDSNQ